MVIMAIPLCIAKAIMVYKLNHYPEKFRHRPELWEFLGIYKPNAILSVFLDVA